MNPIALRHVGLMANGAYNGRTSGWAGTLASAKTVSRECSELKEEVMDYQMLAIVLLFVGVAMLIAEFFIPSGGMIGVMSAICMITSIWAAYKAWWGTSYFWIYVLSVMVIVPTAIFSVLRLLETTSLGNRVLLTGPAEHEVAPYQAEQARLRGMVGRFAKTVTQFNPGGMLVIEGERFHAFSEGLLIAAGETVEIADVRGNRLVVRPMIRHVHVDLTVPAEAANPSEEMASPVADQPQQTDSVEDLPPLDFDMPAR